MQHWIGALTSHISTDRGTIKYSFTYYFGVDKHDPTKLSCFPARITSWKLLDEYSHKAVSTEQPKQGAVKKSGVEKQPLNFLLLVK